MTRDEMKQVLRDRQAGYDILREFNLQEARRATFEDRLRSFRQIMAFSGYLPRRNSRADDDIVTQRWIKIRDRYDATK